MQICKKIIFSGRVQGVGFRYTTNRIARNYPVQGYVKNLPDGTVELMAEGEEDQVAKFVDEISEFMAGNILDRQETQLDLQNFPDFSVRS